MDLPVELLITTIAATTFVTFLFKRTHAAAPAKLDKSIVYGVSADFLQRFAIKHNCTTTSYPTFPKGIHPNPPHWWTDGDMIKNTGNVTSAIIVPATTKYASPAERRRTTSRVNNPFLFRDLRIYSAIRR